jgi:hypothetical protein
MKRILAMVVLIIVLVMVVTIPFIIWGETGFASFSHKETGITSFLLASIELIGLVVSIAIVVFILYQYIRYRRPYRLVFDAFSNESTLGKNGDKPLNLSILAKEELVHQFKIIYREIMVYKNHSDKGSQDLEAQVADELYIEEDPSGNDIGMYVSVEQIKKSGMIEDLEDVFSILTDSEEINLMNMVGEIAPKEVTPVMKFIEAIFPPHIIRATGHLQCESDKSRRVGITFEIVDLGSQRNLMVRTLRWQSSDNIEDSADMTSLAKSNTVNETIPNGSDYYIELLSPAMHWVALMFWEQKLISHVPPINRILKVREKRRQARILYLLGALYYSHADQFRAYKSFFRQLAVEHLRQALTKDLNWYPPYLYLANLYSFKMQEVKEEMRQKLLMDEALSLFKRALDYAQRTKKSIYTQHRIIIDRALAELVSGARIRDDKLIDKAEQEVLGITENQGPASPSNFDPKRADCAIYLYNLALWYASAEKLRPIYIPDAEQKARRYLAYSLARSEHVWDAIKTQEEFKTIYGKKGLYALKQILDEKNAQDEKLKEEYRLVNLMGDDFKTAIDDILREVDKKVKDWTVDET